MQSDILHQTLAYLKDLPASSPQWETDVPTFLSSVTKLTEEKEAELAAAASLQALSRAIEELIDQYSAQLEYFELDVSGWTATTNANASSLAEAHGLIEELSGFIDEHSSIPERGSSLSETRHHNEKREKIEERILSAKSELDQILKTHGGSADPPRNATSDPLGPAQDVQPDAPEVSTDATLSDIRLSGRALEFDPIAYNYALTLHNSVDSLDIVPVPNAAAATVDVKLESPKLDGASLSQTQAGTYRVEAIGVGQTNVSITVMAEDGMTSQTYFLSVERAPSDDAALSSLDSTAGMLEFTPAVREYNIELPDGVNGLSVRFKATQASATVTASIEQPDGAIVDIVPSEDGVCEILGLEDGQSTLSLAVTAEDGVTRHTYTITLTCRLDSVSEHVALMWSLVAEDDLAGAYWISKSLSAQNLVGTQLPMLLKAAQAARWLSPESSDYVEDLFETVSKTDTPFDDDVDVMLSLAASIQPSLMAPETNLLAWLDSPSCLQSIEGIVSPVRNFANFGYSLSPEHIRGDEWQSRLESLVGEASSNARRWLEDSSKRSQNLVRASNVWRNLCTDGGILSNLLGVVAADQRSEVARVRRDVESLRQEAYRAEVITELDRTLRSSPRSDIVGAARGWLHRGIIEATDQTARWCDLVERANEASSQSQNQWLSDHVAELRANIEAASEDILNDISEVASNSERTNLAAAAVCLARSIHRLLDYLSIDYDAGCLSTMTPVVADILKVNQNASFSGHGAGSSSQIESALSRRLLWITSVELGDDGLPVNAEEPIDLERAEANWFSTSTPLEAVVRSRISNGDLRFLDLLSMDSAAGEPATLEDLYSADLTAARETLGEHLSGARAAVEQAANDGVLEFEGARWSELTFSLDDIEVATTLNFKQAHDTLEGVEGTVQKERNNRREELKSDWKTLTKELEEVSLDTEVFKRLSDTFKLASRDESLDIRVMEDCVTRVRDYLSGDRQDLVLARSDISRETLEDFLRFSRGIGDPSPYQGHRNLRRLLSQSRDEE